MKNSILPEIFRIMTSIQGFRFSSFTLFVTVLMLFSGCDKESVPVLSTLEITEITQTTAVSGGTITNDGGVDVIARGVCWSTSPNPTIIDNKIEDGTGSISFYISIIDLEPNTTYYVRAYATNSAGTGYGNIISFTTLEEIILPVITTEDVSEITQTTAVSGGVITNDGGGDIIARGVVWSTSQNPTLDDNKTEDDPGPDSFTSNISDLEPGTTYYVRAYATNIAGTGYGNALSFTTLQENLPVLYTYFVHSIRFSTAVSGGVITDDGGRDIIARGVVWSTSRNPTLDDNKTENGSGTGWFRSQITDLEPSTTYYVRAYATNSAGTGYGNEISFTTLPQAICEEKVIIDSDDYINSFNDPFVILDLLIIDNCIHMLIEVAMACSGATWVVKLVDSGEIIDSNPPQRNLIVSFKNNEQCTAVIRKEFAFDITELQVSSHNKVYLTIVNTEDSILYEY
jgi:hypothetical protein